MLLRADARRARDDYLDITLSLPFQTEVNTGFGVLAKVYLDALTHINNRQRVRDPNAEGVKEAKAMALEICEDTFPGVKYPKQEVERGFRFWDVFPALASPPMLDFAPMLVPLTLSASDDRSHTSADDKYPAQRLLVRQQYTVQIIQLTEATTPPPRNISSVIDDASSSAYSSSSSSSSLSSEDEDEVDEESACSSYCSSDIPPEHSESQLDEEQSDSLELSHETISTTQRILAWRENFSAQMIATASEVSLPSSLKRKISLEDDDDSVSRFSKRSRSQASQDDASALSLSLSCPACDASFLTPQSLRQHGHDAKANEACCVAVEYAFE
ncbi:hypothetical protein H0H93_006395 [Arthromyces matolae]|nr:hypothetical protein H0H93_006395 [Arthromyces matolae]